MCIINSSSISQVLPNTLMDISQGMPPKNYFVLAGLCVLAAYFSKRFLEDLYDKINNIEKKTDNIEKKADEAKKAVEDVELQSRNLTISMISLVKSFRSLIPTTSWTM